MPSQLQLAWTTWSFCIADGVGCSLRCLWLAKCPILLSCDRIITNIFHRCTENMKCMYWRREFIHEQYVPSFLNGLFGFAKYQHSCIKAAIHRDKSAKQNLSEYIFLCCCLNAHRISGPAMTPSNLVWILYIYIVTAFFKLGFYWYYYLVFPPFNWDGIHCWLLCISIASNIQSHREPILVALDRWACCCSQSWKVEMCLRFIKIIWIHIEVLVVEENTSSTI